LSLCAERQDDDRKREFALQLIFNYTDGTSSNPLNSQFNPDSNLWQYAAVAAVAEKAYASVTVWLIYDYNVNTVYFDGIQLFKEEFGTSYTYDGDGNVISVVDLQKRETTYEYDADSNLTQILQDNKAKMTYEYDGYHNVSEAISEEGLIYHFTYDTYGNNTAVFIDADMSTILSTAAYTADGNRLVSTTDALGNVTTYGYNADTNTLDWVQYPGETEATRTNYFYDGLYRLDYTMSTTDTGDDLFASYVFSGNHLIGIQAAANSYYFDRGDFGLVQSVSTGDYVLANYQYTNDGNNLLSRLDYGNNDRVNYTYDDNNKGRLTKETFEDGDTVSYTYSSSGNLATVTDSATGITSAYYYDLLDRLERQGTVLCPD